MDDKLLTVNQVCEILSTSRASVWTGIKTGHIPPPVNILGKSTRWKNSDIQEFIKKLTPGDREPLYRGKE
jgi:predicted DNA-binding transcriptional regulator AlpA